MLGEMWKIIMTCFQQDFDALNEEGNLELPQDWTYKLAYMTLNLDYLYQYLVFLKKIPKENKRSNLKLLHRCVVVSKFLNDKLKIDNNLTLDTIKWADFYLSKEKAGMLYVCYSNMCMHIFLF